MIEIKISEITILWISHKNKCGNEKCKSNELEIKADLNIYKESIEYEIMCAHCRDSDMVKPTFNPKEVRNILIYLNSLRTQKTSLYTNID